MKKGTLLSTKLYCQYAIKCPRLAVFVTDRVVAVLIFYVDLGPQDTFIIKVTDTCSAPNKKLVRTCTLWDTDCVTELA